MKSTYICAVQSTSMKNASKDQARSQQAYMFNSPAPDIGDVFFWQFHFCPVVSIAEMTLRELRSKHRKVHFHGSQSSLSAGVASNPSPAIPRPDTWSLLCLVATVRDGGRSCNLSCVVSEEETNVRLLVDVSIRGRGVYDISMAHRCLEILNNVSVIL